MTTKTDTLIHAEWCKAHRIEDTPHTEEGITTTRCIDCGVHKVEDRDGKPLPLPTVTGALVAEGRGDMDITVEHAPPTRATTTRWPNHADNLKELI